MSQSAAVRVETASDLGPLPEWDLVDLYPGRESPELQRDLAAAEEEAAAFQDAHAGKLAGYGGPELAEAIAQFPQAVRRALEQAIEEAREASGLLLVAAWMA